MLRPFFSLIFILIALAGCTRTPPTVISEARRITQNRQVGSFNQIVVEGTMNVSLHTGYKQPRVILHGDVRDLQQVITEVRDNGSLFVHAGKGYPRYGNLSVDIRSRYLNSFTFTGSGTIKGARLQSGALELSIDNPGQTTLGGSLVLRKLQVSGGGNVHITGITSQYLQLSISDRTKVQLVGVMNLSKLNLAGDGLLSMYWVKSNSLTVCGKGRAFMQLAGIVDKLDVELWDNSHFYGRYLRAKRAFVKTYDRSIAEISAVKHQHTLATDASDIYFYKIPDTKADFMAYEGSVLDMREWDRYAMRDYDRYNK
ncbi:GIN domain-containing protein [Legionella fairfieldensis]|uniref:GIN domain-containing protein n=1 Tax=Legionella fairfieldensis TaxID=45064 RepID=UPI00048CD450|nr:DUF2807 domain-containing protein [Legionella fairfieldensis]